MRSRNCCTAYSAAGSPANACWSNRVRRDSDPTRTRLMMSRISCSVITAPPPYSLRGDSPPPPPASLTTAGPPATTHIPTMDQGGYPVAWCSCTTHPCLLRSNTALRDRMLRVHSPDTATTLEALLKVV